jgi:dUTP pyrophosphatase
MYDSGIPSQLSEAVMSINVNIQILPHGEDIELPKYETSGSAGMDLSAAIEQDIVLKVGERKLIPCGFAIALPEGFEAQIRPRSGLAFKNGVTVLNSPGTIDSDYRGEIKVILINLGQDDFVISKSMRIAQMVIAPVIQSKWNIVTSHDETSRGSGGFGSTGVAGKNAA